MIALFAHQKGGVGKSTAAINFLYGQQKHYKDIAILDLDSQHSTKLFNQLRAKNEDDIISCYTEHDVVFEDIIQRYKGKKDNLLVIDSGGYDSDINRRALVKADIIVTPVGLSQIELFGLQKFRKMLKEASEILEKDIKSHILLNNIDSRSKNATKDLQEYINGNQQYFHLLETIFHTRADYKHSYGNAKTVKEFNKNGKAAKEVKSLVKEINSIINTI